MRMAMDFETEVQTDFVLCRCIGEWDLDKVMEVIEKTVDIADRKRRSAMLMDLRRVDPYKPDTIERFEFGVRLANLLRGTGIRFALVAQKPLLDSHSPPFGETVARNRGVTGLAFTSMEEAEAYLVRDLRE